MQTLLGFDFGVTKIGVAVGQTLTATATPLEVVAARDGQPDWSQLDRLIKQWRPDAMVVGEPLNMDDSDSPMAQRARKFRNRLADRYHCPVHLVDERLSSRAARTRQSPRARRRETKIDAVAAQVILETWLAHASDDATGVRDGPA
ncbi:MAG: Holliday junction resolvase RuvX [Pseudomonadota bacterium]|nr:Holliday junction resolvase RuvX [Pseudomonadota bacterium]